MKPDQVTIAVTGVGAPLGQSIARAAMASKRNYKVIVLDITDEDAEVFPGLPYRKMTHIRSAGYQNDLERILLENYVDLLFLGSEREMLGAMSIREGIERNTGAKFAGSDERSLRIGMDKLLTIDLLREAGLPYPRTRKLSGDWPEIREFAHEIGYPCIVKGRRAGEPVVARDEDAVAYHFRTYDDGIIQEFLGDETAREYTVGLFYTPEHGVIDTYCMSRLLRYGLTWRGKYEKNGDVEEMSRLAIEALRPCGSCNVQLRYHHGIPVIHEINVRCSSTTVFRALSGWNEIDMAVDYFIYRRKPEGPKVQPGHGIRFFQETWVPHVQ